MDIKKIKAELSKVKSQLVVFSQNGEIKHSCNTLIKLKEEHNLYDQLDFLSNLWNEGKSATKNENIRIPCLNILIDEKTKFVDLTLQSMDGEQILFIEDQTAFYTIYQQIQQDRNLVSIQEEQLELIRKEQELFFSKVNHELRTPLNSIIGLSHLLQGKTINQQESLKYTQSLISCSQHLKNIINDILDLSKLGSLTMELIPKGNNIRKLLEDVISSFEYQMQLKNLKFSIDLPEEFKTQYYLVDELRFKQIFINLINNAIKFSSNSTIYLSAFATKNDKHLDSISFSIADEGTGISEDELPHLFTEYTQATNDAISPSLEREHRGTGLGLAIVKQLIELHNGTISVKSTLGIGTTILFNLPLKKITYSKTESLKPSQISLKGYTGLIVEDDKMNSLVLEHILKRAHCETISCESAEKALKVLKTNTPIDFVLTDYHLEEMTGESLRANYFSLFPHSKIKWFLISGTKFQTEDKDAILQQFEGYLTKPICPNHLLETLSYLYEWDKKKSTF